MSAERYTAQEDAEWCSGWNYWTHHPWPPGMRSLPSPESPPTNAFYAGWCAAERCYETCLRIGLLEEKRRLNG